MASIPSDSMSDSGTTISRFDEEKTERLYRMAHAKMEIMKGEMHIFLSNYSKLSEAYKKIGGDCRDLTKVFQDMTDQLNQDK